MRVNRPLKREGLKRAGNRLYDGLGYNGSRARRKAGIMTRKQWKQYAWDCLFALAAWTFFICGAVGILGLGMYLSVPR